MGQGQSTDISPPWIPGPGKRYPKQIEQAIIDLAQSDDVFLIPADNGAEQIEFVLDDHYDEIEAVVQFDNQLALQAERLVPDKLTEQQFWSNYFSHVNALRQQGDSILAAAEAEKPTTEDNAPAADSVEADAQPEIDSHNTATDIQPRIEEYLRAAVALPSLPNLKSQMRWGIVGSLSDSMLQALSIPKVSIVVGAIGSRSPKHEKKLKEFSNATELITATNIDAVYIGECSSDLDCIELCRLALQSGKHCLVNSYRAFSSAYALQRIDSSSQLSSLWPIASFSWRFSLIAEMIEKRHLGSVGNIYYQFSIPSQDLADSLPSNCSPFEWSAAPVLEILDFVFGPLHHVQGYAKRSGRAEGSIPFEDSAVFHFQTGSGAVGCAIFNFDSNVKQDLLTIDCSLGQIILPVFSEHAPKISIQGEAIEVPDEKGKTPLSNEHRFVYSFIGDCETGRSKTFSQRQKRTGKLIDIILRSYYGDRHDYFWTRPNTWENVNV